jgi:uncharacterized RDD family membrane protein YckC
VDLDDRMSLVTPEGVVVDYSLADVGSRTIALLVDVAIQSVFILIGLIPAALGNVGIAISTVIVFVVLFGYPTAFDLWGDGRSPGKRAFGLQVRMANGSSIGFVASMIRNLLRLVDGPLTLGLFGIVSILATKRHQRLGDLAASTVVVRVAGRVETLTNGAIGGIKAWDSSQPVTPILPQDIALLDVSAIGAAEVSAIQQFLIRRWTLDGPVRYQIGQQYSAAMSSRVVGLPPGVHHERALELIVAAKTQRG